MNALAIDVPSALLNCSSYAQQILFQLWKTIERWRQGHNDRGLRLCTGVKRFTQHGAKHVLRSLQANLRGQIGILVSTKNQLAQHVCPSLLIDIGAVVEQRHFEKSTGVIQLIRTLESRRQ